MDQLPTELLAYLSNFLSLPALLSMQLASRTWRHLSLPLLTDHLRSASAILHIITPSQKTICVQYIVALKHDGLVLTPASQKVLEANHYVVEGGKGSKWWYSSGAKTGKGQYALQKLTIVCPYGGTSPRPIATTPAVDTIFRSSTSSRSSNPEAAAARAPSYIPPTTIHQLPPTPLPTSPTRTLYTLTYPDIFKFTYALSCFRTYDSDQKPWLVDWLTKDDIVDTERMVEYFVPLDVWVSPAFLAHGMGGIEDGKVEKIKGGGDVEAAGEGGDGVFGADRKKSANLAALREKQRRNMAKAERMAGGTGNGNGIDGERRTLGGLVGRWRARSNSAEQ
ncbi:hypothetical protein HDV00_009942 [Rhizophlyctis rosea]|nr:hypothetical protein HDV00_009942 [Rhizophlyctis rosea]